MKAMVYAFIDNIKSKPSWSGEIFSDGKTPIDRTAKILQKAQHGEIGDKKSGNIVWKQLVVIWQPKGNCEIIRCDALPRFDDWLEETTQLKSLSQDTIAVARLAYISAINAMLL
jgi:hypothetical protein